MRPLPTTFEIVETIALREPQRLAVSDGPRELTFAQLHGLLVRCGAHLHRLGVRRGQRVAVGGPGLVPQLVLLLAAEGLGAATASLAPNDPDAAQLFSLVDWVFAGTPQDVPAPARFVLVDGAFWEAAGDARLPPPWQAPEAHELQRISRTSGSTGRSKFMAMSRAAQESWIRSALNDDYARGMRLLVLGPFVINAAFTRASAALRVGGAVMVGPPQDIAALAPTHVWGLPLQLEQFLQALPAGWQPAAPVEVATVGGFVTPQVRQLCLARLGGRIGNRYGSNEAGAICDDLDARGEGFLTAGVDVRILDDEGRDLPPGRYGRIAVRTPAMADGYFGLPEENAASFRDGWFVSSDVGALVGPRRLRLAGRQDDLVNVGGLKVPAADLEAKLREQPAIDQCAVVSVNLDGGAVTLGVAMVLAPGATAADAQAQLQQALQIGTSTGVRFLVLERLPHLHTGKLDRVALQRLFLGAR